MPVRRDIPYNDGVFFITFTSYKWLPLIAATNSYDLVYGWFDYLKKQHHSIAGYVIMPNQLHVLINFSGTTSGGIVFEKGNSIKSFLQSL